MSWKMSLGKSWKALVMLVKSSYDVSKNWNDLKDKILDDVGETSGWDLRHFEMCWWNEKVAVVVNWMRGLLKFLKTRGYKLDKR